MEHALSADGARSTRRRSMYRRVSPCAGTARMPSFDATSETSVANSCHSSEEMTIYLSEWFINRLFYVYLQAEKTSIGYFYW